MDFLLPPFTTALDKETGQQSRAARLFFPRNFSSLALNAKHTAIPHTYNKHTIKQTNSMNTTTSRPSLPVEAYLLTSQSGSRRGRLGRAKYAMAGLAIGGEDICVYDMMILMIVLIVICVSCILILMFIIIIVFILRFIPNHITSHHITSNYITSNYITLY